MSGPVRQSELSELLHADKPIRGVGISGAIMSARHCRAATAARPASQTTRRALPSARAPARPHEFEVAGRGFLGGDRRAPPLGVQSGGIHRGGLLGLFASVGFLALALAFLGRGRARRAAVAVMVAFGALTALLGIRILGAAHDPAAPWLIRSGGATDRQIDLQQPTVRSRLAAWETGLKGWAERPLLGWGPGNFGVVFGAPCDRVRRGR